MKTVVSHDIDGKAHDVPIDKLYWRPSAYGIVIKNNKVLLVPQFHDNWYDLPGGGVDLGETLEDAVIREVKEETGLDVAKPQLQAIDSSFFTFTHDDEPSTAQCILLYYACELVGGEISTDGFDKHEKLYAKQAVWLPIEQLDSIHVASSFDFRDTIRKVAAHANSRD